MSFKIFNLFLFRGKCHQCGPLPKWPIPTAGKADIGNVLHKNTGVYGFLFQLNLLPPYSLRSQGDYVRNILRHFYSCTCLNLQFKFIYSGDLNNEHLNNEHLNNGNI